jgi:hypothetical protein
MMAFRSRFLSTAALVAALAIAPAVHAEHWHGDYHHHGGGGGAAGAAIIGGLVGLGVGAAIASNGGYSAPGYYAPPYSYAPPPAYYAPPPPAVYYGY